MGRRWFPYYNWHHIAASPWLFHWMEFMKRSQWKFRLVQNTIWFLSPVGLVFALIPSFSYFSHFPFFHVQSQELLEDKNILKVGFNPKLDIPTEINAAGTLDLNFVRPKENFPCFGLTKLARRHLNVKLRADASPKLQRVKENLERNEAHISIELFKEFTKKRRPKVDESNSKESLQRHIEKACSKYLDKKFDIRNEMFRKPKKSKKSKQSKKADNSGPTPEKSPRTEQASNKADKWHLHLEFAIQVFGRVKSVRCSLRDVFKNILFSVHVCLHEIFNKMTKEV